MRATADLRAYSGRKFRSARRATSPAELFFIFLLILLLIAILLPSMIRARDQAKATKCMANLKQQATAMHMYFNEENDWFPWEKDNSRPAPRLHAVYYGGHPGRSITPPEHWWGYIDKSFRDTPGGRPFNRFLYPDLPKYDVAPDDPMFETVRNMPVYQCPDDAGGGRDRELKPLAESPIKPLYREQGTSYVENYNFSLNWALANVAAQNSQARWQHFSNAFIKRQLASEAGLMIVLAEDPFDCALRHQVARRGWHGLTNKHNFAFLDGHAARVETKTDLALRGVNWKSCGAADLGKGDAKPWWENPDDPDYKFREIAPLPDEPGLGMR